VTGPVNVSFAAATTGAWAIDSITSVCGAALPAAARLTVLEGTAAPPGGCVWRLRGVTSHERYVTRAEREALVARQPALGRPEATCAAFIPIRKSQAWWNLPQDERRAIFEERSRHIAIGLQYVPAVARRLHYARDLGEPFDFLTWFEYAPRDARAFEELVGRLRATEEWRHVEREVDIRLSSG